MTGEDTWCIKLAEANEKPFIKSNQLAYANISEGVDILMYNKIMNRFKVNLALVTAFILTLSLLSFIQ